MKFLKFKATNLFSIKDVDLSLDNQGLLLISGENGAGKSSVSHKGLIWCLYGSTSSGLKADDVINLYAETNKAFSQVEFVGQDGRTYQVTRQRSPNRLTFKDLDSGQDLTQRHEKESQELINRALGRTFETFLQTDFFGQGKSKSFFELTAANQIELLESILPVDKLKDYIESAKEKITGIKSKINSNQLDIRTIEGKIFQINKQKDQLQANVNKWQLDFEIKQNKLLSKLSQVEKVRLAFFECLNAIDRLIPNLPPDVTKEEVHANLKQAKQGERDWTSELNKRRQSKGKCPTCSQSIPCVDPGEVEKAEQAVQDCRVAITYWQDRTNLWNNYDNLSQQVASKRQILEEFEVLQQELVDLEGQTNPFLTQATEDSKELEHLEGQLQDYLFSIDQLEERKTIIEFWVNALNKDFRTFMLQRALPYLNDRSNYYLSKLGNQKLSIEFSTITQLASGDNKNKFSATAKSSSGGAMYDALSGAEQQLVSLAVSLALSDLASAQTSGPTNLMILDECFTYMDANNCSNLISFIMEELSPRKETILLVSNDDLLKDQIPNKLHVIKTNGLSEVIKS